MTYIAPPDSSDGIAKVIYESKDGKTHKTFDALDWLVRRRRITHIPNKGESAGGGVRYYGFYSNKSRGLWKKAGLDDQVPALIEPEISSKEFRKNWARLIRKIYHVNPLVCSKCSGSKRIIAFIEDQQIVKKILKSAVGGSSANRLREPMARRLTSLLSITSYHLKYPAQGKAL